MYLQKKNHKTGRKTKMPIICQIILVIKELIKAAKKLSDGSIIYRVKW
ncbi:MAG: hypothetical protein ACTS7E_01560 [Arsenophonus sp. NC-CH8-MAG3]